MLLDIHTHNLKTGERAVLSIEPEALATLPEPSGANRPEVLYSVGFHPWNLPPAGPSPDDWALFKRLAERPDVVAIGECGLDLLKGPILAIQMNAFREQAETADRLGKPLIIHCVKGYEQIISIKKELKPKTPWIIHGFRGKASVARMLITAGFYLSIGEKFNPQALAEIPSDRLLLETDESTLPITAILTSAAQATGKTPEALQNEISDTITAIFGTLAGLGEQ